MNIVQLKKMVMGWLIGGGVVSGVLVDGWWYWFELLQVVCGQGYCDECECIVCLYDYCISRKLSSIQ